MSEDAGPRRARWWIASLLGFLIVLAVAVGAFWGDLVSTALDPKVPFQTYEPPPAPEARELFPDEMARFPSGSFLSFLFFVLEAV